MKIICFGDSLTRGVSFVKGRLRILKNHYPASLQELFQHNKENDIVVMNKGVFNDNSDLLLTRLEKDVIEEHPSYVIIGIGGNDCNFHWDQVAENPENEHTAIVPIDRYIQNVKSIITKVKDNGITPILLTLPPLDPVRYYENISKNFGPQISQWICKVGGIEHWHGMYNRHLKKLIDELDVMKIDVRSSIKQAGDLFELISDDGIHLTEKGYKELAMKIYDDLLCMIDTKTMIAIK